MRVNLSGCDHCVAKHGLNATEVGSMFDKVRGEGVTKDMRRNLSFNPHLARIFLEPQPKVLATHGPTSIVGEENTHRLYGFKMGS